MIRELSHVLAGRRYSTPNTHTSQVSRTHPLSTANRSTSPAHLGPEVSTARAGAGFLTACVFRRDLRLGGSLHAATQRPRSSSTSTRHA